MTQLLPAFFALLAFLPALAAAQPPAAAVSSYQELLTAIREVRRQTESRIETAVQQEKVREAWQIGKLIDEHILLQKERQKYGEKVVLRLAEDLEMSESELNRMIKFARAYPIQAPGHELTWSHYRSLITIEDREEREALAQKAEKEGWNRDQVRAEINRRKSSSSPHASPENPILEEVKPGKTGIHRVIEINGKKHFDLGFSIYKEIQGKAPKDEPPLEDLYTYHAVVAEIYDGDSVPRKTAQEMRVGPSEPICGNGFQSALSGFG